MNNDDREKQTYEPPRITRIDLDDRGTVGMVTSCKFELMDANCYADGVTPIMGVDNPS